MWVRQLTHSASSVQSRIEVDLICPSWIGSIVMADRDHWSSDWMEEFAKNALVEFVIWRHRSLIASKISLVWLPMERNSFRPRGYRHAAPLEQSRELLQWRRRWRRFAMMRCLFVRIGECEQMSFVPGTAKDRQARGQRTAACETHRHGDRRKTRRR